MLSARLARIEGRIAAIRRIEARYPWLRLAAVLVWAFGTYLVMPRVPPWAGGSISAVLLAVFVAITIFHRRVLAALERYQVLARLTRGQLARVNLDWPHIPLHFPVDVPPEHPFDRDLIVTGPRSLHQLLDTTSSTGGSLRLADWLLQPRPDVAAIHLRQRQVRELLALPGLRARLALGGALMVSQPTSQTQRWDGRQVAHWVKQDYPLDALRIYLIILGALAAANMILFLLNTIGLLPAWWVISMTLYLTVQASRFRETSEVFGHAYDLSRRLEQLRGVLSELETYPFQPASELARLCAPFCQEHALPSQILRQVRQDTGFICRQLRHMPPQWNSCVWDVGTCCSCLPKQVRC